LVNFIPEAILENKLTSSSTAKEVSGRIDLLQTAQFIADSWRFRTALLTVDLNMYLEMPHKADSKNSMLEVHHVRYYEEFSCIDSSLQCYSEKEDCEEAVVVQIAVKHQQTSVDQKTDEDDMTSMNE
jgi:hypothetical protein